MRPIYKSPAAALIGCLILAMIFIAPSSARASERDLMTKFTVNHPFEVPGVTLQPNTRYTIRLFDSPSTRNVVEVLNADETKLLTRFIAASAERPEPADRTTFTFIETAPGYPMPIKEWFYPGRTIGLEFIYPKKQALEIARHAKEPVLSAESVNLHDLAAVKVEAIRPLGAEVPTATAENGPKAELPPAEQAKPMPAPEPVANPPAAEEPPQQPPQAPAIAENKQPEVQQPVAPPPASAAVASEETNNRELPKTAGELPLMALIGTICVGAGIGFNVLSARS
jgi:hypothetical protein